METKKAFLNDAYLTACEGRVIQTDERGIVLDCTNFYANSGGQPGDTGSLERADGCKIEIRNTIYDTNRKAILLIPSDEQVHVSLGETLISHLDWERRYKLMRMHTACHLLSVVCPFPITSANVNEVDSRVDFDIPKEEMESGINKETITEKMMALVRENHPINTDWITEAQLDANPDIVKSKNVRPPKGLGDIRLVCIGDDASIDSQPCGGTHVSETQEVGEIHIGKIENKGKENRRIRLRFGSSPA